MLSCRHRWPTSVPTRPRLLLLTSIILTASVLLAGCAGPGPDPTSDPDTVPASPVDPAPSAPAPSGPASSDRDPTPRVEHVVVVSLDGLGSELLATVGLDALPTLAALVRSGASTVEARTAVEATVTLPNHASMLTGRPIALDAGGHGVSVNADRGQTVADLAGKRVSSVFDTVHAAGGSTALFATEDKFALFARSWPDSIDRFASAQDDDDAAMTAAVEDLVTQRRALTFLHLGQVDEIGHAAGWLSAKQQRAVTRVDTLLGTLVAAVDADPDLARHLVLVVTADHGGVGRGHGDADDARDYAVPFFVRGPGVEAGTDLYDLSPRLTDPGTAQPAYDAASPPLRNGCVANVVARLLRLPPVAGSTLCRQGLGLSSR